MKPITPEEIERKQHLASMRESAMRFRAHIHPQRTWVASHSTRMGWAVSALSQAITYRGLARKSVAVDVA